MRQIRTLRVVAVAVLAAFVLAAAGCISDSDPGVGDTAIAVMKGADGADMGTVTFTQGPRGVLVSADVKGLSEGWHGFHVHEAGDCSPDFGAAGGHFAPNAKGHGFMHSGGGHPGDMPNILRRRGRRGAGGLLPPVHHAFAGRRLPVRRERLRHHHPRQAG